MSFGKWFSYVLVLLAFSVSAKAELKTVDYVDLVRFAKGDWYQISHNPLSFEGGPCACARQRLAPMEDGRIYVYNSCNDKNPSGKLRDIKGTATVEDKQSNSKLSVDFGLPFKGTYWIIGLASDYRFTVVSNSDERALYILSKTPTMTKDDYKAALAMAAKQLDTSKLKFTEQKGCTYPK
jgi:apolipoprotein D and lipocalin family protein